LVPPAPLIAAQTAIPEGKFAGGANAMSEKRFGTLA